MGKINTSYPSDLQKAGGWWATGDSLLREDLTYGCEDSAFSDGSCRGVFKNFHMALPDSLATHPPYYRHRDRLFNVLSLYTTLSVPCRTPTHPTRSPHH